MTAPALPPAGPFSRPQHPRLIWIATAAIIAATISLLAGCRMATMIERLADDEKEAVAQGYLQQLIDGEFGALERELDPSLRTPNVIQQFEAMRGLMPAEAPVARNLVGYLVNKTPGGPTRYDLTYQLDYGDAWLVAYTAWREDADGNRILLAFRLQPLSEALQTTHALNFDRARPRHYLFTVLAAAVLSFNLVSLVACIRTKFPRRKWLWILFVLVGVGQLTFNWTSGQIGFAPFSLQLFSAGLTAPGIYAPWRLSVSLPLGAILFWFKRRRLLRIDLPPPIPSPSA